MGVIVIAASVLAWQAVRVGDDRSAPAR
jgi:hypothetical protein